METIPANKWVREDPDKIGHESIINSTMMHPHLPFIATAGIERHVLLHSPTATTPCTDELTHTPTAVRELPEANFNDRRRMLRALIAEQADNELDQDRDTIALFDE
ncbi:hypothetical protein PHLCEN_2v3650 [Hermanssonia centrifuga]|uniref:Uncharacterized protein n=1 Tax=Hermanssonia centrifuga TaxID=98765 RepID=A0A2R6QEM1_9APHY|nr:hypothetical protein PHLCEN_2v3650 [Hermanssonia centrifuga]